MRSKILLVIVVSFLSVCKANAEICISFQTDGNRNTVFDHTGAALAGASLYVVFWSPDANVDFNTTDPLTPLNGDIRLDVLSTDGLWPQDGAILGNSNNRYGTGTEYALTGRVYVAIFEMPYASYSGSIPGGTYYGVGPVTPVSMQNSSGNSLALPYDYGDLINTTPVTTSLQTVPEPGTWGLMILGIATMFSRCRRKK